MARVDHKIWIRLSTLLIIAQPICLQAFKCEGQCVQPSACIHKTTGDCPREHVCCHSTVNFGTKFKSKTCAKSSACERMGGECVKHTECKVSKDKILDKNWSVEKEGKPNKTGRSRRGNSKDIIKDWWLDWIASNLLCGGHGCVCCLNKEKKPSCPTSKSCWQDNSYRGSCVASGECVPPNSLAPINSCMQDAGSCQCCLRPVVCNGRESVKCKKMDGSCTDSCESNEVEIPGGCISNMCKCCAPSACNPRNKCSKRGGFCVMKEKDCSGTILKNGCHGDGCICCLN